MAEEPNQDNERDGHAQEQQQNGTHLFSPSLKSDSSNNRDTIPLFAADRGGKARAKRANQKSEECPVHGVRDRFAGGIGRLLRLGKRVIHSFLGIRWAHTRPRRHDLGQIRPVCWRQTSFPEAVRENESDLAAHRRIVFRRRARSFAAAYRPRTHSRQGHPATEPVQTRLPRRRLRPLRRSCAVAADVRNAAVITRPTAQTRKPCAVSRK